MLVECLKNTAMIGQEAIPSTPQTWTRSHSRSTPFLLSRGRVETRTKSRRQFIRRFLYSDLQPLELGVSPDPHPEGPSLLPAEAPVDIRKELTNERQRERLKKAAVLTRLPRLTEAAASRDAFLRAAGNTTQGSQSLRICEGNALAKSLRDGDALSSAWEEQRRDLWFDRAKTERNDLGRETRMLDESMRIIQSHEDIVNMSAIPQECIEGSRNRGVFGTHEHTHSENVSSFEKPPALEIILDDGSLHENSSSSLPAASVAIVRESSAVAGIPPEEKGSPSVRTMESKMDEIFERQTQVQQVAQAQKLLAAAKKSAVDLVLLADMADQEERKEAKRLQDMQREEAIFDTLVIQRRVWMAKNEKAVQSRLRYQEAVETLHRVQAEWGPTLGLEVPSGISPRTMSSSKSNIHTSCSSSRWGSDGAQQDRAITPECSATTVSSGTGASDGGAAAVRDEYIRLWVIGVLTVNVTRETLSHAYYGSFSEADTVPSSGWMAFDQSSDGITVSCVVPKKKLWRDKQTRVDTWVVDGAPFPEVNGRYMERGVYDGVPRYRNPNNIFLFRNALSRSEELGITRQTCLPASELLGEDVESAAATAALSLGREVSGKIGMDFSRLVKTSLQSVNFDRKEKVRLKHQRIARAVAKVDTQFQEQMSQASATLDGVDRAESGGGGGGGGTGGGGSIASSVGGGGEKDRDLAIMAAADSAKLTFQEHASDGDRVVPCEEHGTAPLCRGWVARACPKTQIHCRCRHYFISIVERDRMVAWREGNGSRTELEVLACIAKREALLFEAEKEGLACRRRFLAEARTTVKGADVVSLLRLLDQLRLASVRVVEAVCRWREDVQAIRVNSALPSIGTNPSLTSRQGERALGLKQEEGGQLDTSTSQERPPSSCVPASGRPREDNTGDVSGVDPISSRHPTKSQSVERSGETETVSHSNNDGNGNSKPGSKIRKSLVGGNGGSVSGGRGEGEGGSGRIAKGRWIATMMVPGRKLWDSSPAMFSQYKRFRRSRQDPKIARDQLYLGVFATKNEAIKAYDDAICREAVKQRSSVLRMPKKRIVTRTCGKHMAVQSEDTPPGRQCEQCAAEALNHGVKHLPPYIWNNSNYMLKMTGDLEFLADVDPLVTWLEARSSGAFDLKENPFLLGPPEEDGEERVTEGLESASLGSSESSVGIASGSTPPEPSLVKPNNVVVHAGKVPLPSTAAASLPGPSSRRRNNDLSLAVHRQHQEQQRSWSAPTPTVHHHHAIGNDDNDDDDDDDDGKTISARVSCLTAAVTTPRAAWAEDRRSSKAGDGCSVSSSAFPRGDMDGIDPGLIESRLTTLSKDPSFVRQLTRAAFGRPSTKVTRFSNGVQEWCGESAKGGCFALPFAPAVDSKNNNHDNDSQGVLPRHHELVPEGLGPGFPPRQETKMSVEILDVKRIEAALATLHDEEDIADAMSGKPPRQRHRSLPATTVAKQGEDGTTGGGKGASSKAARGRRIESADSATVVGASGVADRRSSSTSPTGGAQAVTYSKKAPGDNAVGATIRGRRMRDVLAVYRHRGAQLVLQQSRNRHPFRVEGVFCRQDRGEWAGQVHVSASAKKFLARKLLDKVLERRNKQRGRVGRMMHKLIERGQPIHRLQGPRLCVLLSEARGLGGDRLTIDIAEAEAALRLFDRVEESATIIQALVRGVFGREESKRFAVIRRKKARLKKIIMNAAGAVAEEAVEEMLRRASRRAKQFIRRPVTASVGVFQDGRRMIVSALPVEQRGFAGSAPKAATNWHQLCSACQGRSAHRTRSCKSDAEEIFRGVCSCRTVRPLESARLTAYDPVTGEQVHMTISGEHLTRYLLIKRTAEGAEGRQIATSSSGDSTIDYNSTSMAKGLVIAAARLLPLPWDAILGYGNPKREAGTVRRRFWEPYHEARLVQKVAENARLDLLQLCEASTIARAAAAKATSLEETTRARHETWRMNAEDIASHRRDLVVKFLSESAQSREALAFSWRSVQQMENRDAEDWTQGWDPFENGNNWRQLINRRATDRALTSSTQAGLIARDAAYRAREDRAASKHWANEARAKAGRVDKAVEMGAALVESLDMKAKMASRAAIEALKLLTALSRPTVKAAGQLQKRLVIEEGGHNREKWDALFRGGMVLETPNLRYVSTKESRRRFCVVTVRRDARTGRIRVTASGDDKAVDLFSATLSAAEVTSVVWEEVGGRRGKELVAPVIMDGGYAAIRRVQEARRKEILQVFVESLHLDLYQNEMAVGKLYFIRRSAELRCRLLESLWHQDAVAGRSSGRGTEILRQFHRLGPGWVMVAVYETWGDLFFEAYDPATTSTLTLQTSFREVLESLLSSDRAAAGAFLLAVRTCTFPRKLVRQVLNRLDIVLPGENGLWWRRPIDGETPHLVLISGGAPSNNIRRSTSKGAYQQYRGPIWTEERFSSGKAVTARVLVSGKGDYLVEVEARDAKKQNERLGSGSESGAGMGVGAARRGDAASGVSPFSANVGESKGTSGGSADDSGVLRLEVRARELRAVFRVLDRQRHQMRPEQGREGTSMGGLLAPDHRVELCRYLLDHIALEDVHPNKAAPTGNGDAHKWGDAVPSGAAVNFNRGADIELREAYTSYKAWAAAVEAPIDRDPLREIQQGQHQQIHQNQTQQQPSELSPSEFSLVLRPDIDSDEHLLPIHESPWTPDGKLWLQAKISLCQRAPAAAVTVKTVGHAGNRNGEGGDGTRLQRRGARPGSSPEHEPEEWLGQELESSVELTVTLRPEGVGQRRARLETEETTALALEDERSTLVSRGISRLENEVAGRAAAVEEARRSSRLTAAMFTARTRNQNRIKALIDEEQALVKKWAEKDVILARKAALEVISLLRLETRRHNDGEKGALILRLMETNTNPNSNSNRGGLGPPFLQRRYHVLDDALEGEVPTTTSTTSMARNTNKCVGLRRSFALQGRRESAALTTRSGTKAGAAGGSEVAEKQAKGIERKCRTRTTTYQDVEPAPLRGVCGSRLGSSGGIGRLLVRPERRYRGEGLLERRGARSASGIGSFAYAADAMPRGPHDEGQPALLAQQVLRLEGGLGSGNDNNGNGVSTDATTETARLTPVIAVATAVLEPSAITRCNCDGTAGNEEEEHQDGRCEVRSVVRVEAYFPGSSTTLTLRVQVPPPTSASSSNALEGIEGLGSGATPHRNREHAADHAMLPLRIKGGSAVVACVESKGHKEECRSRKHQRRALRDARYAVAKMGDAETFAAVQEATTDVSNSTYSCTRRRQGDVDTPEETSDPKQPFHCATNSNGYQRRGQDEAFSMLLIRAHAIVPVTRLNLGSGSWREAIGELVGCPAGQELRTLNIDRSLVFALNSSCPAPFNAKAHHLLGISVQGDVVWVRARAEEKVLALLEADGQLMGQEREAVDQLGSDQPNRADMEQRVRWYDKALNEAARRMLPALSRSCFSVSINPEDAAATEVRSLLDRAWCSGVSELRDDPLQRTAVVADSAHLGLARGAEASSTGSPAVTGEEGSVAPQGDGGPLAGGASADSSHVRPWHVLKTLLRMHVLACKIPGPACPVPCCHQSRARASAPLADDDVDGAASTLTSTSICRDPDGDAVLLREIDRCIMWYWESKEPKRQEARKIRERTRSSHKGAVDGTATAAADGDDRCDENGEQHQRAFSPRQLSVPTTTSACGKGGGGGGKSEINLSNVPRSSHRPRPSPPSSESPCRRRCPFEHALQALELLTATAGKPHEGVSASLLSSSSSPSSLHTTTTATIGNSSSLASLVSSPPGSAGGGDGGSKEKKGERVHRQTAAGVASAGGRNDGEDGGGRGAGQGRFDSLPSSSGRTERCRVAFDMIRLLTGPDGNDARGRPVGVKLGEDVEAAVLGSGGSQVSRWVMNRLRMGIGGEIQSNARATAEWHPQVLFLDTTHATGAVCISGTRLLLTIAQMVDGSISVSGHDPLTCQTAALALDPSVAKSLSLSEGLPTGPTGRPIASVVAKHLMRNAARLLEVQTVGGVETLGFTSYNRADDESLASSASSGLALHDGFALETIGSSPRHQQISHTDDANNQSGNDCHVGRKAGRKAALDQKTAPTGTSDETGLVACRIRRLEAGRRQAKGFRRAASVLKLAAVAQKQREMLRKCDPEVLASAKSSFEALLCSLSIPRTRTAGGKSSTGDISPAAAAAAGLYKDHVLALQEKVVQELSGNSGDSCNKRGSIQLIVETVRRGSVNLRRSVQMMAEGMKRELNSPPISPAGGDIGNGNGTHGTPDVFYFAPAAATAAAGGNKEGEEKVDDDTVIDEDKVVGAVASTPRGTVNPCPSAEGDGASSSPNICENEEVVLSETGGASSERAGGDAAFGGTERRHLSQEPSQPGRATDEGFPSKPQEWTKTGSPSKRDSEGEGEVATPAVTLEDLLVAVAGLSQKVEEEGSRPMGMTAYAAWWVGAVSQAELELKRKFLSPESIEK